MAWKKFRYVLRATRAAEYATNSDTRRSVSRVCSSQCCRSSSLAGSTRMDGAQSLLLRRYSSKTTLQTAVKMEGEESDGNVAEGNEVETAVKKNRFADKTQRYGSHYKKVEPVIIYDELLPLGTPTPETAEAPERLQDVQQRSSITLERLSEILSIEYSYRNLLPSFNVDSKQAMFQRVKEVFDNSETAERKAFLENLTTISLKKFCKSETDEPQKSVSKPVVYLPAQYLLRSFTDEAFNKTVSVLYQGELSKVLYDCMRDQQMEMSRSKISFHIIEAFVHHLCSAPLATIANQGADYSAKAFFEAFLEGLDLEKLITKGGRMTGGYLTKLYLKGDVAVKTKIIEILNGSDDGADGKLVSFIKSETKTSLYQEIFGSVSELNENGRSELSKLLKYLSLPETLLALCGSYEGRMIYLVAIRTLPEDLRSILYEHLVAPVDEESLEKSLLQPEEGSEHSQDTEEVKNSRTTLLHLANIEKARFLLARFMYCSPAPELAASLLASLGKSIEQECEYLKEREALIDAVDTPDDKQFVVGGMITQMDVLDLMNHQVKDVPLLDSSSTAELALYKDCCDDINTFLVANIDVLPPTRLLRDFVLKSLKTSRVLFSGTDPVDQGRQTKVADFLVESFAKFVLEGNKTKLIILERILLSKDSVGLGVKQALLLKVLEDYEQLTDNNYQNQLYETLTRAALKERLIEDVDQNKVLETVIGVQGLTKYLLYFTGDWGYKAVRKCVIPVIDYGYFLRNNDFSALNPRPDEVDLFNARVKFFSQVLDVIDGYVVKTYQEKIEEDDTISEVVYNRIVSLFTESIEFYPKNVVDKVLDLFSQERIETGNKLMLHVLREVLHSANEEKQEEFTKQYPNVAHKKIKIRVL